MTELWQNPVVFVLITTVVKFVAFGLLMVMPLASLLTWMERRQSAYAQDRLGPTRAHFFRWRGKPVAFWGLLHIAADGIKMFFKEPFMPRAADAAIFRLAPAIAFVTALTVVAFVPFGPDIATNLPPPWNHLTLQMVRLDSGLLFVFAIASLGIYGATLAGWSSNNRFALLGSLRAAAQSISYEVALGLTAVGVLICFGTTELSQIVTAQEGAFFYGILPRWGIVYQPFAAVLFLVAAIAETKRGPFDLPEGESEIIGYFVEYSSMGFGLFMLSEFIEIVVLGALFTTLFLGGWQLPWVLGEKTLALGVLSFDISPWVRGLAGMAIFGLKVFLVCALQLQIRWTLPRFRYDQLMRLGWKSLLPLALINIFATALLVAWDPTLHKLALFSLAGSALFLLWVLVGPRRQARPHLDGKPLIKQERPCP